MCSCKLEGDRRFFGLCGMPHVVVGTRFDQCAQPLSDPERTDTERINCKPAHVNLLFASFSPVLAASAPGRHSQQPVMPMLSIRAEVATSSWMQICECHRAWSYWSTQRIGNPQSPRVASPQAQTLRFEECSSDGEVRQRTKNESILENLLDTGGIASFEFLVVALS